MRHSGVWTVFFLPPIPPETHVGAGTGGNCYMANASGVGPVGPQTIGTPYSEWFSLDHLIKASSSFQNRKEMALVLRDGYQY